MWIVALLFVLGLLAVLGSVFLVDRAVTSNIVSPSPPEPTVVEPSPFISVSATPVEPDVVLFHDTFQNALNQEVDLSVHIPEIGTWMPFPVVQPQVVVTPLGGYARSSFVMGNGLNTANMVYNTQKTIEFRIKFKLPASLETYVTSSPVFLYLLDESTFNTPNMVFDYFEFDYSYLSPTTGCRLYAFGSDGTTGADIGDVTVPQALTALDDMEMICRASGDGLVHTRLTLNQTTIIEFQGQSHSVPSLEHMQYIIFGVNSNANIGPDSISLQVTEFLATQTDSAAKVLKPIGSPADLRNPIINPRSTDYIFSRLK